MFKNENESRAWSTFFAAQCPRIINPTKVNPKELEVAAGSADLMLEQWRQRQPAEPLVEITVTNTEDAPAKDAPKRTRQRRTEAPAPEKKEEEKAPERNADYGTGDGENYR